MSQTWSLTRGRVYSVQLSHIEGEKPFVIVSNNRRNAGLEQVLAVRLTTSRKPKMPSIVELPPGEVFVGSAMCDDITEIWGDEIRRDLGALTPKAMAEIGRGLKAALDLK
ncbi:MAG: type II toxin-antitoxin system PemK/MazF family toxin [Actinomycetes bacterium]